MKTGMHASILVSIHNIDIILTHTQLMCFSIHMHGNAHSKG